MSVAGSPQDIGEGADGSGGSGERGGAKPVTGQGREGARERGSREAKVCVCVCVFHETVISIRRHPANPVLAECSS